jgi:hypothetical protein
VAIVDGRTELSGFESGDSVPQPDDLSGAAGGTVDTEIFIQGVRSYGYYTTTVRDGLLYDAGSAQDWSNNHFYLWVNCGVAGLLDTLANGGMAVRFCGATATDWFEVNIAGSDDYPDTVQGGWAMLVVDIEKAKTASDRTNGTPPATNAIRYVGVTSITSGTMPRMVSNTWLDAMWRLPASTAGIRVEGQAGGPADWTWADIAAASDSAAWGTCRVGPGGAFIINTPIQFGANDAATHGFSDTNQVLLWEDWDVAASFYGLTVIGGSGTQSFEAGIKTGTGDDATGAQGWTIAAAAGGQRWFFDADDANVDACNMYGCAFIHGGDFQIDGSAVSFISDDWIDCDSATVSNAEILRCAVVDANTADGVAFMTTDDLTDIVFCSFEFSDGHAVELTTPRVATQASKGNRFTGYGADATNDAAVYNDTGGAVTINVTDGGSTPTVRNGSGASTTVNNTITYTLTDLQAGTEVRIFRTSDDVELAGVESSGTAFAYNYTHVADVPIYVIVQKTDFEWLKFNDTLTDASVSQKVLQRPDLNYVNP